MRLYDCGQVAASALFYTSRRCQGGGAALESGVSTELGWLRGMGDKVGPKTLSETVPHRARNHKTRRAHKAPLLYEAVVEPRAVERLSVWSTTDARGRIVRLRVGGQGQAVRRGGRTCRRLRCGCLARCNSRRERWVVPCAVAPPIRLTGGRVLDRCVEHTEGCSFLCVCSFGFLSVSLPCPRRTFWLWLAAIMKHSTMRQSVTWPAVTLQQAWAI